MRPGGGPAIMGLSLPERSFFMAYGFIEGCVDSHASALAACRGGADRLELCAKIGRAHV